MKEILICFLVTYDKSHIDEENDHYIVSLKFVDTAGVESETFGASGEDEQGQYRVNYTMSDGCQLAYISGKIRYNSLETFQPHFECEEPPLVQTTTVSTTSSFSPGKVLAWGPQIPSLDPYSCGQSSLTSYMVDIVGESGHWKDAGDGEVPWHVSIKSNRRCAGALISPKHVITSSLCTTGIEQAEDITVVVGKTVISSSDPEIEVVKVTDYPSTSMKRDISILELKDPVTLSRSVQP